MLSRWDWFLIILCGLLLIAAAAVIRIWCP